MLINISRKENKELFKSYALFIDWPNISVWMKINNIKNIRYE